MKTKQELIDLLKSDVESFNKYRIDTDFEFIDLPGAYLCGAYLRCANLRGANLRGADITNVKYSINTSFFALQCPAEGSFIAFKKAHEHVVKLRITENALRSSATTRKCRASEAEVIEITSIRTGDSINSVSSDHDADFIYEVGKTIKVDDFDPDRWNECSTGIHFFMTKQEAIDY